MENTSPEQEEKSNQENNSLEKSDSDFSLRKWRTENKEIRTSIFLDESNENTIEENNATVNSPQTKPLNEEDFKHFDDNKQINTSKEKSHTLSGAQQQQFVQQVNEAKAREKPRTGSILNGSSQKNQSVQFNSVPNASVMPASQSPPSRNESAPINSPIQNASRPKAVTLSSIGISGGRRQLSRVLSSRAYILELVQKLKNQDSSVKINSGTFVGKDLVDWIVRETNCERQDALEMAHKMLESNDIYLAEEYDSYLGQVVSMQIDSDSVLLSFESIKHRKELMISRFGVTPQIAESIFAQKKKIKDKLEAQLANPKLPILTSSQEASPSQSPPPERKIREPAPDAPGFSFSRPPPQRKPPPTPQRSNSVVISKTPSSSNTPIPKVPSSNTISKSASPPKATSVPVKCDRCEQPATIECLECNIPLCPSCSQLLHAGKWSSHTLVPLDKKSDSSSKYKITSGIRNLNIGSLPDLVKAMTDKEVGIKLRDRKYFIKTYKNVFDGGECVDWILRNLPVRNRAEAVSLGAKLLENKYIEPIQSGSPFKDEDKSLYKFTSTPLLEALGEDQGAAQRVTMDDFELLQVLGSGGFGKVIQVRKKETGKIYAMKIIKKSKIKDSQKRINDILNEKTILQNDNSFLVHLHYSFQTSEALCFVVDFISGGDLWFHLKRMKNGFPKKIARFFAAEIVLAIEYLHSQGVVYRDLKPENVLVDADGHICLTDFGIATILEEDNRTNSIVGTTCFMAPEVLKGLPYGKAVDWWSLGVLLYHMLTGRHPFYSSNKMETIERIMTKKIGPTANCPSKRGFDLIEKLLERNPELRLGEFQRIRKHPFFRHIEWEKLAVKKMKPPFKIAVAGPHDLSNFEDEMKRKPIFTEVEDDEKEEIDYFPDFTFVNRSVL